MTDEKTESTEQEKPLPPGHCPYCKQKIRGHGWTLSVPFKIGDMETGRFTIPISEESFEALTIVCKRHLLKPLEEPYITLNGNEINDFLEGVKQSQQRTEAIEYWARLLLKPTGGKRYQDDDFLITSSNYFDLQVRFKAEAADTHYEMVFELDKEGLIHQMAYLARGEQSCWKLLKAVALKAGDAENESKSQN